MSRHEFNNTLFTPDCIESMHDIRAVEIVAICVEVMNKITQKSPVCNVREGFQSFDEKQKPGLIRALVKLKTFLKLDDVTKFMKWRDIMANSDEIVLQFKHRVAMVFEEAFEWVRMGMVDTSYTDDFCDIRPYDPVDWIVHYMTELFKQGNYIFKRSGKDIDNGVCVR